MNRQGTYFGFKPQWKQAREAPNYGPIAPRKGWTDLRDGNPPRMRPGRHGPRTIHLERPTITLDKTEYSWVEADRQKLRNSDFMKAQRWARLAAIARFGTKTALRLNPYVRAASYLWDAYEFYREADEWAQTRAAGYDFTGWEKCCETSPPPYAKYRQVGGPTYVAAPPAVPCAVQSNCGLGLQVPTGDIGAAITFNVPSGSTGWYLETVFLGISQSAGTRMRLDQKWTRLVPRRPGGYVDTTPYNSPVVVPVAMRLRPPRPLISEKGPVIFPEPWDEPVTRHKPYAEPALQFDSDGAHGAPPKVKLHYREPPEPDVQERKRLVVKRSVGAFAGAAFGAVTEALDIVDALYKALPKNRRDRHATYQDKLIAIAQHLDEIAWTDALINFIENELKDRLHAKIGKIVNKPYVNGPAQKYWVRPTGPTTGHRRNYVQVRVAR